MCERNASITTGMDRVVAQYLFNTCLISCCVTLCRKWLKLFKQEVDIKNTQTLSHRRNLGRGGDGVNALSIFFRPKKILLPAEL